MQHGMKGRLEVSPADFGGPERGGDCDFNPWETRLIPPSQAHRQGWHVEDPVFGLKLCCCHFEILNFWTRGYTFLFCTKTWTLCGWSCSQLPPDCCFQTFQHGSSNTSSLLASVFLQESTTLALTFDSPKWHKLYFLSRCLAGIHSAQAALSPQDIFKILENMTLAL